MPFLISLQKGRNPEKGGAFAKGGVTQICRKLHKIAGSSFCTSEEGCAKLSQTCREFESQFRTILCKYLFFNAPFSEFLIFFVSDFACFLGAFLFLFQGFWEYTLPKKQGKSLNGKSKEIQKSKGRGIRVCANSQRLSCETKTSLLANSFQFSRFWLILADFVGQFQPMKLWNYLTELIIFTLNH